MKKIIILILLNILLYQSYGQTNDTITKKLTKDLEQINLQGKINGFSVAIVNQDRILYTKGFGYSDVLENKTYTKNTIQNIASISKTFIGVALLKAEELGKLNLDDPINKYLPFEIINPYFPETKITVRQLANHTSSILDSKKYWNNTYILKDSKIESKGKIIGNFKCPDKNMDMAVFLEKILSSQGKWNSKKCFNKSKPGELFKYSNIASALAAYIIENATGESFNSFTKKHIFLPLKMSNSGWHFKEVDFSKYSKLYFDKTTELAFYQSITYPDGGLITSSNDLGKYLSELIAGYCGKGKILTNDSYKKLFKPYLADENVTERNESVYDDEYNMGIFMGISAKGQIGHTGGDPGVQTYMFFNTKTKTGKIIIANTSLEKEDGAIKEFWDIWNKLEEYEIKL